MTSKDPSPLTFPCRFPIKAMGRADGNLASVVTDIVARHDPALGPDAVRSRPSRAGNYVSVTVLVQATSREQLDAIYRDLTAHEEILWVL